MVTELFSRTRYFAGIFGIIKLSAGFGSVLMATLLAGGLYDIEAKKQGTETCIGQSCFRSAFLVSAAICIVACVAAVVVVLRTREHYRRLRASLSIEEERQKLLK